MCRKTLFQVFQALKLQRKQNRDQQVVSAFTLLLKRIFATRHYLKINLYFGSFLSLAWNCNMFFSSESLDQIFGPSNLLRKGLHLRNAHFLRKNPLFFFKISLLNRCCPFGKKTWKVTYHVRTLSESARIFVRSEVPFFCTERAFQRLAFTNI